MIPFTKASRCLNEDSCSTSTIPEIKTKSSTRNALLCAQSPLQFSKTWRPTRDHFRQLWHSLPVRFRQQLRTGWAGLAFFGGCEEHVMQLASHASITESGRTIRTHAHTCMHARMRAATPTTGLEVRCKWRRRCQALSSIAHAPNFALRSCPALFLSFADDSKMLSRAFSRLTRVPVQAANARRSINAFTKFDGDTLPPVSESNSEIDALEKMIADREAHRNRHSWYPFRYTYMVQDLQNHCYYYYGGFPGWYLILVGTTVLGSALYFVSHSRVHSAVVWRWTPLRILSVNSSLKHGICGVCSV